MVLYFDIDETIFKTDGVDYNKSKPIIENIKVVNSLYDEGHEITLWTARGALSGIDWYDLTKEQLDKFGVKYHFLKLDKPFFDLFVDDKVFNSDNFFKTPNLFIKKIKK